MALLDPESLGCPDRYIGHTQNWTREGGFTLSHTTISQGSGIVTITWLSLPPAQGLLAIREAQVRQCIPLP